MLGAAAFLALEMPMIKISKLIFKKNPKKFEKEVIACNELPKIQE